MKFRLYVDPPSAMRAGNERILDQFVDVDLSELSDAQREIVASSYLAGSPPLIDLGRMPNGDRVPELSDLKIAVADSGAVISMIQRRLDALAEDERLKAFAHAHFEAAVGPLIARYTPVFNAFREDRHEEGLIESWVKVTYGEKMMAYLKQPIRRRGGVNRSENARVIDAIEALVDVRLLWRDDFKLKNIAGRLEIDTSSLPEDEAGIAYLRAVALDLMKDENRKAWVSEQWAKRREALEEEFMAELNSKRADVEALLEIARKQREVDEANEATVMSIVTAADARRPEQSILARYREGVLPEDELLALLRDVAFAALQGTPRFKRIGDSEVKRKRGQDVSYEVVKNTSIKAMHFQLAKDLKTSMPEAVVEQVRHLALIDGEPKVERDAVRVTVDFAGHILSREYVPADK